MHAWLLALALVLTPERELTTIRIGDTVAEVEITRYRHGSDHVALFLVRDPLSGLTWWTWFRAEEPMKFGSEILKTYRFAMTERAIAAVQIGPHATLDVQHGRHASIEAARNVILGQLEPRLHLSMTELMKLDRPYTPLPVELVGFHATGDDFEVLDFGPCLDDRWCLKIRGLKEGIVVLKQ